MSISHARRRIGWQIFSVFAASALMIGVAGYLFYRVQREAFEQSRHQELAAIGELKARQIANWRQERINDANFFFHADTIARRVKEFFDGANPVLARAEIEEWLGLLHKPQRYERLYLLDPELRQRIQHPNAVEPVDQPARKTAAEALRQQQVILSDFHQAGRDDQECLYLAIPLFQPPAGAAATAVESRTRESAGVFVFQIDARKSLFPLVGSKPVSTLKIESLLVWREGEAVFFVTDRPETGPRGARRQLSVAGNRDTASVAAALGHRGIFEGTDYRGSAVVAHARAIEGADWLLVVKTDSDDLHAKLRGYAFIAFLLSSLAMVATGLAAGLLWQNKENRFRERELELAQRLRMLTQHANDIILLLDEDGRIIEANDRALQTYGYSLPEIQQLSLRDLRGPEAREELDHELGEAQTGGGGMIETQHRRKDGSTFPVESSLCTIRIGHRKFHQTIVRNIAPRKEAEEALRQLSARLLKLQDEERRRLARDLHDTASQTLAALTMTLTMLKARAQELPADKQRMLEECIGLAKKSVQELRTLSYLLHPPMLEVVGLSGALREYVEGFSRRSGIAAEVECADDFGRLPLEVETSLFRIVQECLSNVHRHSGSPSAAVRLDRAAGEVVLAVRDEGCGIDSEKIKQSQGRFTGGGVGLAGMQERLLQLGGRLEIQTSSKGTCVVARLPVDRLGQS